MCLYVYGAVVCASCSPCICDCHILVDYSVGTCIDPTVLCDSNWVWTIHFQLEIHFHPLPLQWNNLETSYIKQSPGTLTSLFED